MNENWHKTPASVTFCKEDQERLAVLANCTSVANNETLLSHETDSFKHGTSQTHTDVQCTYYAVPPGINTHKTE
jgi:hypothetical protein